ncbi:MAG: hypothetical protein ABI586_11940, partial [Candidatus Nanopelagicales bacterium]
MTASQPLSTDPALQILWPTSTTGSATFRALPNSQHPRLLIPTNRRTGRATLRALRDESTRRARVRTRLLLGSWGTALAPGSSIRLPAGGITEYVSDRLGREIVVGVHLGPARANRKPVLALVTPAGEVVGYAKLGVNRLTDRLVANEAEALVHLNAMDATALKGIVAPRLLLQDSWAGHSLVVQSALSHSGRAIRDPRAVTRAQVDVAHILGTQQSASDYVSSLVHRLHTA